MKSVLLLILHHSGITWETAGTLSAATPWAAETGSAGCGSLRARPSTWSARSTSGARGTSGSCCRCSRCSGWRSGRKILLERNECSDWFAVNRIGLSRIVRTETASFSLFNEPGILVFLNYKMERNQTVTRIRKCTPLDVQHVAKINAILKQDAT